VWTERRTPCRTLETIDFSQILHAVQAPVTAGGPRAAITGPCATPQLSALPGFADRFPSMYYPEQWWPPSRCRVSRPVVWTQIRSLSGLHVCGRHIRLAPCVVAVQRPWRPHADRVARTTI